MSEAVQGIRRGGMGRALATDSFLCEVVHGCGKAADAREDEALGVGDVRGGGDVVDTPTQLSDGIADTTHITSTIIQQRHTAIVRRHRWREGKGGLPTEAAGKGRGEGGASRA